VDGDDEIALLAKAVGDAVHRTTAASERATHEHRRFTALFQRSLDAVLMIEDGRVVEANRAAHDLLGTGLTGRQYVDLLPAPSGSRAAIRSHASPTSPARELALAGVDGQLIPVEIREIVMAIDGRDCLAVLIKDLREVRAAEREQRLLASVIDSTSDLVLILDVRGRPHSANGALRLALGRDPAEDWAADLMPPEQRERFRLVLEGARSNPWRGEAILAGIGPLPVSAVAFPIHDHQGEATHLALVMRDMRAEVEREAALHAAREEAEAAAKAKASFLAVMSHELRTPLNGVIGMASLLDRTPMSTTQADYVRTISVCAEGLLAQINDVLDLTRLESDGVVLEHLPIDVRTLAEDVLGICAPRAAEKGLELILDAPALPTVEGDPSRLRQALVNLVGNAVKFTPTGHVLLRIRHEPGRLQLAVEDTGIGMAPEVLKRLFTPFVQADESMTRRFGGTGLGLAISRRLVRLMGGDIAVHSATGSGSCFTISLPMSGGGVTPPANLRGLRVLVIDHRPAVAAAQAGLLTSCGAVVRRADRSTAPMPGEILLAAGDHPGTRALLAEVGGVGTVPLGYAEQLPPNIRLLHRPVRLMALQNALTTATPVPTPATATPASTGRPVVLVVEDNETNRLMVRAMLELTNCDVVDADNGLQALERLRTQRFDVVLMDGQMPILDGFEAVRQWRDIEKAEGRPRTPVVALTAMAMAGDDARCTAAGMDDYLTKPFTVDRLTAVIRRWVGHGA
jgi:signal transduction histidine kinase/CheY-like chemotaxis protein